VVEHRGMSSRDYFAYLDSPEWWAIRKLVLRRAEYRCERCDKRGALEVHHRTYCRLGDESSDDLEVLCPACHRAERLPHNLRKRVLEQLGQLRLFDRWVDLAATPIVTDLSLSSSSRLHQRPAA
jgi:hypothetical protein